MQFVLVFLILVWWGTTFAFIVRSFSMDFDANTFKDITETFQRLLENCHQVVRMFMLVRIGKFEENHDIVTLIFINICLLAGSILGMVIFGITESNLIWGNM